MTSVSWYMAAILSNKGELYQEAMLTEDVGRELTVNIIKLVAICPRL